MRVSKSILSLATAFLIAPFFHASSSLTLCSATPAQSDVAAIDLTTNLANTSNTASASTPGPSTLNIGVIVYNGTALLDYVGIGTYLEFLSMYGVSVQFEMISQAKGVVYSAPGRVPVHSTTSFRDASSQFDLLLVPGGPGRTSVLQNQDFLDYIAAAAASAQYVLVVCTGAEIVASTGFLDGKNATTNKIAFDTISTGRPTVNWIRKARWVVDGTTWTSSGVSAGTDMGRAFVAAVYNATVADKITRTMEYIPDLDPANDIYA